MLTADPLKSSVLAEIYRPFIRTRFGQRFRCRFGLGNAGVDANAVLARAPPGYRLNIADGDCDLDRFIAQKDAGIQAAAAGQSEEASRHMSAALAEWRGPVLDDLSDFEFVKTFATALIEDMLVHISRAEAEIACGRAHAVIGELETLVAQNPYREPLWAKLMTAYYVVERQSDALDAYRRLKTALADDLGIDPGPTVSELHARILRQERLNTKRAAKTTAMRAMTGVRTATSRKPAAATLRDATGRHYPVKGPETRIGRLAENDIVLNYDDVSRRHAVIIDTGSSFVITDLDSSNGVTVQHERIRPSATLADGDCINICGHEFTFEITR